MNDQELESLVISLSADVDDLHHNLQAAVSDIEDVADHSKEAADRIEGFVGVALRALEALGATEFLKGMLEKFQEAEKVEVGLRAVLAANGRQVEETVASYKSFATAIQDVTTYDDDQVLALLKSAETFGLHGDAAKRAARDSIALAAVTGNNAETMIRFAAALGKGDIELAMHMGRLIPQLRGIKNESEFVAKAQHLIASGMDAAKAEALSSAGSIQQLQVAYDNLKEELGAIVADAIKPVVGILKEAVHWFQGLSEETKTTIVILAGVAAGVLAISAAIGVAGIVFNTMFGGAGLLLGLIITIGGSLALWVSELGGVKEAWGAMEGAATSAWSYIKEQGQAFLTWFHPIWQAVESIAQSAWDNIAGYAQEAWDFTKGLWSDFQDWLGGVWKSIVGDASVSWHKVADSIQEAILTGEYSMNHLGDVFTLGWGFIKLGFISLTNDIEFFFTDHLPAILSTFIEVAGDLMNNLPQLLLSGMDPALMAGQITAKFAIAFAQTKLPTRAVTQQETDLINQLGKQVEDFNTGLDDFIESKKRQFGEAVPEDVKESAKKNMEDLGLGVGEAYKKGADKGIEQLDALLIGSAEDVRHLAEYQDQLLGISAPAKGGGKGGTGGGAGAGGLAIDEILASTAGERMPGGTGQAGLGDGGVSQVALLRDIRDSLIRQENEPGIEVVGAGLVA